MKKFLRSLGIVFAAFFLIVVVVAAVQTLSTPTSIPHPIPVTATSTTVVATTSNSKPSVVRSVSSATTTPHYGIRTKTVGCIANQVLPDPECSPGAILTTDLKIICVPGYTKTVRNVPDSVRKAVFAEYGIPYADHANYEVDHIISLELGGSNDIANLYPESYLIADGARVKDKLENHLHAEMCAGRISVAEAQRQIATDWLTYYRAWKGEAPVPPTIKVTTTPAKTPPPTTTSSGPIKKSSSGICHSPTSSYYDRTTTYTAYPTIDACVASGGRLPNN